MVNTERSAMFEVWLRGKRIFYCEDKSCIPAKQDQTSLLNAGYTLFLNGQEIRSMRQ